MSFPCSPSIRSSAAYGLTIQSFSKESGNENELHRNKKSSGSSPSAKEAEEKSIEMVVARNSMDIPASIYEMFCKTDIGPKDLIEAANALDETIQDLNKLDCEHQRRQEAHGKALEACPTAPEWHLTRAVADYEAMCTKIFKSHQVPQSQYELIEKIQLEKVTAVQAFYTARQKYNYVYARAQLKASHQEALDLLRVISYFQQHIRFGCYRPKEALPNASYSETRECFSHTSKARVISNWESVFDKDFLATMRANKGKNPLKLALILYEATDRAVHDSRNQDEVDSELEKVAKEGALPEDSLPINNAILLMRKELRRELNVEHAEDPLPCPVVEFLAENCRIPMQENVSTNALKVAHVAFAVYGRSIPLATIVEEEHKVKKENVLKEKQVKKENVLKERPFLYRVLRMIVGRIDKLVLPVEEIRGKLLEDKAKIAKDQLFTEEGRLLTVEDRLLTMRNVRRLVCKALNPMKK